MKLIALKFEGTHQDREDKQTPSSNDKLIKTIIKTDKCNQEFKWALVDSKNKLNYQTFSVLVYSCTSGGKIPHCACNYIQEQPPEH